VIVWYNCEKALLPLDPSQSAALRAQLASVVQAAVNRGMFVLLTPYADMPHRIALTAWRTLDAFDDFDEARVVAFISSFECRFDPEAAC